MGDDRWYEQEFELSGELREAADAAMRAREEDARTYDVSVGAAVLMYDGEVFTGANRENLRHDGVHAEEDAILAGLRAGYAATDFRALVVVFVGEDDGTVTTPCLQCQATAWDYTHPRLEVIEVSTGGEPLYRTRLGELVDPPGDAAVYPSAEMMGELSNHDPQLPLAPELQDAYEDDDRFRAFCDAVGIRPGEE